MESVVKMERVMASAVGRYGAMGLVAAVFLMLGGASAGDTEYSPEFTDAPSASQVKEYVFGVHPLHNPERLFAVYGPIMDYLSMHIPGARFRLEASRNYAEFDKKMDEARFDFALPNPYQTLRSLDHGYRVFGKMGDDQNFRGIILVRKDGGVNSVADLKGKAVSYPAPTALAATMMPQYYLHTHGLDVNKDIRNVYVGSQESSIMNVFHRFVAAGATWPTPWIAFQEQHPDMANELEVKWQTDTLPNNGLVVRKDVPQDVADKVAGLLTTLHETPEGRKMLAAVPLSRFERAGDKTFAPVQDFLTRFAAEVRPPKGG